LINNTTFVDKIIGFNEKNCITLIDDVILQQFINANSRKDENKFVKPTGRNGK
jgi:hypothetical protein